MNDEQLNDLFHASRAQHRDTSRAEFAFETRLMARLRAEREELPLLIWARRLCPAFVVVVLALAGWTFASLGDWRTDAATKSDDLQFVQLVTGKTL